MTVPQSLLIQPFCDHHVHTSLCQHATGTMEQYVQAAISQGLERISFLEHMEEGITWKKRTWLRESDFDTYFKEGLRLRKFYSDTIQIGLGVECGYNPEEKDRLVHRLSLREWDEIGISCHFLKLPGLQGQLNVFTKDDESIAIARSYGFSKILTLYFNTLIEAVQVLPGNILCHLDGALRHLPELSLSKSHVKQIHQLLQLLEKKGILLEINSSGIRMRGEQFPAGNILEMAKAYNIKLRLGSDAHKPEDVGYKFDLFRKKYC